MERKYLTLVSSMERKYLTGESGGMLISGKSKPDEMRIPGNSESNELIP